MYKVLFAEDELLVRLGLQNSIPGVNIRWNYLHWLKTE